MKKLLKKISKIFSRSTDNNLSYEEAIEMMKKSKNIKLIDVRSIQEYEEEHLSGAINIPLYEIQYKIYNLEKNKSNIIIVYCKSGTRSIKAKKILEKLGYENVFNLEGGIEQINM